MFCLVTNCWNDIIIGVLFWIIETLCCDITCCCSLLVEIIMWLVAVCFLSNDLDLIVGKWTTCKKKYLQCSNKIDKIMGNMRLVRYNNIQWKLLPNKIQEIVVPTSWGLIFSQSQNLVYADSILVYSSSMIKFSFLQHWDFQCTVLNTYWTNEYICFKNLLCFQLGI